MSFLSRAFTGAADTEARAITQTSWSSWVPPNIPSPLEDAALSSGSASDGGAMALSAFYSCVTLIADTIANLSLRSYRWESGGKVAVDPQPKILESPYPGMTQWQWLWMMAESLVVTGNAYGLITARDSLTHPTAIMPVHPDCVTVEIPDDDHSMGWLTPRYYINGRRVRGSDMIHIKRFPVAGCVHGMSIIQKAAMSIGLSIAAERYGYRYFKDSANPSGILSTKEHLSDQQVKRAMKQWLASHQGRRLPAVLTGGLEWQPVVLTPEESQFLATREFQVTEIARWFRIPPHMIGETAKSTSWGSGIEAQVLGFLKFSLVPWLSCIEQTITQYLPRGQFAKFNTDDLLRTDIKTRWEAYRIGRDAGVYSVNEIRDLEDLPPIGPEGDVRLQPANFVPLGTTPQEMAALNQPFNSPAADEDGGNEESNGNHSS